MYTETIRYEQVTRQFTRNSPCPGCGRKVRRQRTFSQTINPWNQAGDGADRHVKTRQEIQEELAAQGLAWQAGADPCSRCKPAVTA
jgi:hypothetical protein